MVGTYKVYLEDRPVGQVNVERQGLYFRFSCRCDLDGGILRLWMIQGGRETDLGLCVPVEGRFGTEKRLPVRQCGEEIPSFFLRPKDADTKGKFIPLRPEEPFRYIHRLEGAYLERRGKELGIVLKG